MLNSTPPALRYFGGKHRDAHKIIVQFPHHEFYIEPFGGGASILLQKQPSDFEVYNDLSGDVVNFFRVLRDRPTELIRAIEFTPYSREEWKLSYEPTDNELESARRLYVRSWQSYSSDAIAGQNTGWRCQYQKHQGFNNVVKNFNRTDHLWILAARLKMVQIECDKATSCIHRYGRNPKALIYADPPYVHSTRTESGNYDHEMTDADHIELAKALHSVEAMVMISGYDCELYKELYKDWQCVTWESLVNGAKRKATECLWIKPNTSNQLPLLQLLDGGCGVIQVLDSLSAKNNDSHSLPNIPVSHLKYHEAIAHYLTHHPNPLTPWDIHPLSWESQGVNCAYDGSLLTWGEHSFSITPRISAYINPGTFVNFLEDSWEHIQQITLVLSDPMAIKTIVTTTNLKQAQVIEALNLGSDLEVFSKEGKLYKLVNSPESLVISQQEEKGQGARGKTETELVLRPIQAP